MPKLEYLINEFNRPKSDPLTDSEYHGIKRNYKEFIDLHLKENRENRKEILKNAYPYKIRLILLLTFAIPAVIVDETYKNRADQPDWTHIFWVGLLIIGINSIWFLISYLKSFTEIGDYFRQQSNYFKFHKKYVTSSRNYEHYLELLNNRK